MVEVLDRNTLEAYLHRIGLHQRPSMDVDGLHQLHWAQFSSIPFENLDIQLGLPIRLATADLIEKLIHRQRGGYCFELNGLMLRVLVTLGFVTRPLLARVHSGPEPSGKTHQMSLVTIADRNYIIDVGFGAGGPRCPILLAEGITQSDISIHYRLSRRDPWGWVLETREETWKDSYSFELAYVTPVDIDLGNYYTSTSPDSHFTRIRTVSLPTESGRISLCNHTFTTKSPGQSHIQEWPAGCEYLRLLTRHFGIRLDADYRDLAKVD